MTPTPASSPPAAASISAALDVILATVGVTDVESVELGHALGRTLAADVAAPFDLPPWDNSAMDGYACRAADVRGAPVRLRVVDTIAAGGVPTRAIEEGEAARIMTGAPVPAGADTVVRVEDTDRGAEVVAVRESRDAGTNVRRRGEDVRAGDLLIRAGTSLRPAEVGMLAAIASRNVAVHRRPRVAILSSGDELVHAGAHDDVAAGRRIVSANNYSLAALVREAGGDPVDFGIVPDNVDALAAALENAAATSDLVVTSGGISVGDYDYTRAAVAKLRADVRFWRVPMRPGYNTAFGVVSSTPWIGVPGNPVSAVIAGEVFVRAAVRRLSGSRAPHRAAHAVVAGEELKGGTESTVFLRATVSRENGAPVARLTGPQGSAVLSSLVKADALLVIARGRARVAPGDTVPALLLRDESGTTAFPVSAV